MVLRAVLLTLFLLAVALLAIAYALRPVIARACRYWRSLQEQDEMQEREKHDLSECREAAVREVEGEFGEAQPQGKQVNRP